MVKGQELVKKVQAEYYNSGGALSLNFEEFCEFFKVEAPVAKDLIKEMCATEWFQVMKTVDPSSGEESDRLQIHPKYSRNFWVYSELVPTEAKAILELGALLKNPLNSGIKNLEIEDQHLMKLILQDQVLHSLPSSIDNFTHLKTLKIQRCKLVSLPDTIGNLKSLRELDLDSNNLTVLPETIGKLENLKELWCRNNKLITLPETLDSLKNLRINQHYLVASPSIFTIQKGVTKKPDKGAKSEYLLKICIIGSPRELKTQFVRRFAEDKFDDNRLPTLGVDITTKKITIKGTVTKLILVDTAGQEFFGKLRPNYYRGASGAIIIFDKGDYRSFTEVSNWLKEFRDNLEAKIPDSIKKKYYSHQPLPDPTPVAIVGLITESEEVSLEEAQALADQLEIPYFECVPTEGKELGKVIVYLAKEIIHL